MLKVWKSKWTFLGVTGELRKVSFFCLKMNFGERKHVFFFDFCFGDEQWGVRIYIYKYVSINTLCIHLHIPFCPVVVRFSGVELAKDHETCSWWVGFCAQNVCSKVGTSKTQKGSKREVCKDQQSGPIGKGHITSWDDSGCCFSQRQ